MITTVRQHPLKRLISVPYWALRGKLVAFRAWLGHAAKAFVMLCLLRPAAVLLPRRAAFWLARFCATLHAAMPFYGNRKYRLIYPTLASDPKTARRLTRAVLSRHYIDFVSYRRYLADRERLEDWPVVEINAHIAEEVRRSASSYIIATGHFSRHAFMPMYLPRFVPQKIISVVNPPIPKSWHPREMWLRAHYGQMMKFLARVRPDMEFLSPGNTHLFKKLLRSIKEPGNALVVSVDAPWDRDRPGSIVRPFAGRRSAAFATGTARLARLTQCPILLCIPHTDRQGQVILTWIRAIQPPDPQDSDADAAITNLLLDEIERAVGMRPDQYVMDFWGQRRWDSAALCWEP